MHINLTPDLEQLLQEKMTSGRYGSAIDVLQEFIQLLEERDAMFGSRADEIRSKISEGLASLECDQGIEGESVFILLEAELDSLERSDHK